MSAELNVSKMMQLLDWCYAKVVDGMGKLAPVSEFADGYLEKHGSIDASVKSLIRWQNTKAATTGFIAGLGGIITLPISVPISVANVLYVQLRMIAAIAHMGGYDLKDDRVQTLVYICLTGSSAKEILKETGITVGTQLTTQAVKNISADTITLINEKVGFRMVATVGEEGVINLSRMVPLVGGVVGGAFDGVSTHTIGKLAHKTFITSPQNDLLSF